MITWFGRSAEQYDTRGASVRLTPCGWVLFWFGGGKQRARGPFRDLETAAAPAFVPSPPPTILPSSGEWSGAGGQWSNGWWPATYGVGSAQGFVANWQSPQPGLAEDNSQVVIISTGPVLMPAMYRDVPSGTPERVPEPSSLAVLAIAVGLTLALRRRA